MSITKRLDTASGALFFSGFMLSKLQYIPAPLASAVLRIISLAMYGAAYSLWFASSLLKPDQKKHKDKWYGFAKINQQFLISSFIGFTATVISVAAIFVPVLLPVAAWLYFLGNMIWATGEYHKFQNPPNDDNFSSSRQKSYFSYAMVTCSISLTAALAATLIIAFPAIAIPVTCVSLILSTGLGLLAFEYWADCNLGNHKANKSSSSSYSHTSETLGASKNDSYEYKNSSSPVHTTTLFTQEEKLSPISTDSLANEDGVPVSYSI